MPVRDNELSPVLPILDIKLTPMSEYITVATYDNMIDMAAARDLLESAGINCFTEDDTASTYALVPNANGNNILRVSAKDAKEALDIIDSTGYQRVKEPGIGRKEKYFLGVVGFIALVTITYFFVVLG